MEKKKKGSPMSQWPSMVCVAGGGKPWIETHWAQKGNSSALAFFLPTVQQCPSLF